MLGEKVFFATINWVLTLSLRTYGMTVKIFIKNRSLGKKLMFILGYFRKYSIRSVKMVTRI